MSFESCIAVAYGAVMTCALLLSGCKPSSFPERNEVCAALGKSESALLASVHACVLAAEAAETVGKFDAASEVAKRCLEVNEPVFTGIKAAEKAAGCIQ